MLVEGAGAVDGVDGRDHRADPIEPLQGRLRQEGLQHRAGVGQARGLDHHMVEGGDLAGLAGVVEAVQGADQVAEHGAAQAAVLQHHDGVVAGRGQGVVEPDLAELVDDHGGARHGRVAQGAVEQRGLAAAEEAGQHRDRACGRPVGVALAGRLRSRCRPLKPAARSVLGQAAGPGLFLRHRGPVRPPSPWAMAPIRRSRQTFPLGRGTPTLSPAAWARLASFSPRRVVMPTWS